MSDIEVDGDDDVEQVVKKFDDKFSEVTLSWLGLTKLGQNFVPFYLLNILALGKLCKRITVSTLGLLMMLKMSKYFGTAVSS